MKTTLNQIKKLNPDHGQFLNLMSYQAKTTPDDVEFPVTDILNATNLEFTLKIVGYTLEHTSDSLEREFEFQKSVNKMWRERFSINEFNKIVGEINYTPYITITYDLVFEGLKLIEDRFERQQTEQIIAAKFLQHFKS